MKKMKLIILGMSKVRWRGAGKITPGMFEIFYLGDIEHERGVAIVPEQEMRNSIKRYWPLS